MKQTLHIFLKDVRRFRWLIPILIIVSGIVSGFMNYQPYLGLLLFWFSWVATALVIHEDALVGDRQFWITRPYSWKSLLAAKLLFIFVFSIVPNMAVPLVVLSLKGSALSSEIPGLVWKTALSLFAMLPIAALAALTRRLATFLTIALVATYCTLVLTVRMAVAFHYYPWPEMEWAPMLSRTLIGALGAYSAIICAYSRRRIQAASIILVSTVVLQQLVWAIFPYGIAVAMAYRSEGVQGASPMGLLFDASTQQRHIGVWTAQPGNVSVYLPFQVDVPAGSEPTWDGEQLSITTAEGLSWSSWWNPHVFPTELKEGRQFIGLSVEENFYKKVRSKPVDLHVKLACTLFETGSTVDFTIAPGAHLAIPGFGVCEYSDHMLYRALECRSAFRRPAGRLAIQVDPSTVCATGTPSQESLKSYARLELTTFSSSPFPAEENSPVVFFAGFSHVSHYQDKKGEGTMVACPGTQLTFTTQIPVRRTLLEFEIKNVRLGDYAMGSIGEEGRFER